MRLTDIGVQKIKERVEAQHQNSLNVMLEDIRRLLTDREGLVEENKMLWEAMEGAAASKAMMRILQLLSKQGDILKTVYGECWCRGTENPCCICQSIKELKEEQGGS
jgi:hypothetical protein